MRRGTTTVLTACAARFKTPASGLIVSAPDLVKFGLALLDDTLVTVESRSEMFAPPEPEAPAGAFALGWQVSGPREGARPVCHSGSMEGVTAFLYIGPGREACRRDPGEP
jgi:CubicO group peptidase (beta-lactamase class C family)